MEILSQKYSCNRSENRVRHKLSAKISVLELDPDFAAGRPTCYRMATCLSIYPIGDSS
jgi:hypothetical protein